MVIRNFSRNKSKFILNELVLVNLVDSFLHLKLAETKQEIKTGSIQRWLVESLSAELYLKCIR